MRVWYDHLIDTVSEEISDYVSAFPLTMRGPVLCALFSNDKAGLADLCSLWWGIKYLATQLPALPAPAAAGTSWQGVPADPAAPRKVCTAQGGPAEGGAAEPTADPTPVHHPADPAPPRPQQHPAAAAVCVKREPENPAGNLAAPRAESGDDLTSDEFSSEGPESEQPEEPSVRSIITDSFTTRAERKRKANSLYTGEYAPEYEP